MLFKLWALSRPVPKGIFWIEIILSNLILILDTLVKASLFCSAGAEFGGGGRGSGDLQ